MNTAVLFLVFNRPDTTQRAFEAIRAARPPRLYVAADGPRASRSDEAARCTEVRRIATAVDWPCEVKTLFRDENLGCKLGVSSGIDWFFDNEAEGIILEDDILPDPSFFPFCEALLERYRDDERVSMISGCNLIAAEFTPDTSYFFSRYLHVWGWASWRRAWAKYDVAMPEWPSAHAAAQVEAVLGGRPAAIDFWTATFDRMARGEIDTWDYQWVFASWMSDMVAVIPAHTLIKNLGFGPDATHTVGSAPAAVTHARPRAMTFPLVHPAPPVPSALASDAIIERLALNITRLGQIRSRLREAPMTRGAMSLLKVARDRLR